MTDSSRTAHIIPFRRVRIECSKCGASANAACGCGASYVPAGTRAAKGIAANPRKSDRAIAAELGVGNATVSRARRRSTVSDGTVGKRVGRDGKIRGLPKRPEPKISDPTKEINKFHREVVGFADDFMQRFNVWHDTGPEISKDGKATLMQAFYLYADVFMKLAQKLDER